MSHALLRTVTLTTVGFITICFISCGGGTGAKAVDPYIPPADRSQQYVKGIMLDGFAVCAPNEDILNKFIKFAGAGSDDAVRNMQRRGDVWALQDGVRVTIRIAEGFQHEVKVDVLDGPHAGKTGWMHILECGGSRTDKQAKDNKKISPVKGGEETKPTVSTGAVPSRPSVSPQNYPNTQKDRGRFDSLVKTIQTEKKKISKTGAGQTYEFTAIVFHVKDDKEEGVGVVLNAVPEDGGKKVVITCWFDKAEGSIPLKWKSGDTTPMIVAKYEFGHVNNDGGVTINFDKCKVKEPSPSPPAALPKPSISEKPSVPKDEPRPKPKREPGKLLVGDTIFITMKAVSAGDPKTLQSILEGHIQPSNGSTIPEGTTAKVEEVGEKFIRIKYGVSAAWVQIAAVKLHKEAE